MPDTTNSQTRTTGDNLSDFAKAEVLGKVFAELPACEASATSPHPRPVNVQPKPLATRPTQVAYQRPPTNTSLYDCHDSDGFDFVKQAICMGLILLGAAIFYRCMSESSHNANNPFAASAMQAASAKPASYTIGQNRHHTKPIEDVCVGDRLVGRNPIREQVELVEPDSATWRNIRLHITKESGLGLWIDLLRPIIWIEEHNAASGSTIYIDLYEMGAVGNAKVTYVGPCPTIQAGSGAVVTGTFKHQADKNNRVVHLKLEDQIELTGVTDNHPYWSEDRHGFVQVGKLRTGELVDTEYGLKRVISVTPIEHNGFLYNLETTEHVYRVGSLGTLVHNNCLGKNLKRVGSYGDLGTDAHHIVAYSHRSAKPARDILKKHGIHIDDARNGVWLPRDSVVSRARGALHHEAGSALTSADYLNEVNRRILAADATGRAIAPFWDVCDNCGLVT